MNSNYRVGTEALAGVQGMMDLFNRREDAKARDQQLAAQQANADRAYGMQKGMYDRSILKDDKQEAQSLANSNLLTQYIEKGTLKGVPKEVLNAADSHTKAELFKLELDTKLKQAALNQKGSGKEASTPMYKLNKDGTVTVVNATADTVRKFAENGYHLGELKASPIQKPDSSVNTKDVYKIATDFDKQIQVGERGTPWVGSQLRKGEDPKKVLQAFMTGVESTLFWDSFNKKAADLALAATPSTEQTQTVPPKK